MKTPTTFKAQSRDLREAARIVLEPGEVIAWEGMSARREVSQVPLLAPWVVRGAVWVAVAVTAFLAFVLVQRWWGALIVFVLLAPVAARLRRAQAWLGPLRRNYYAVTDRRLVLVEPDAFFGVEPGVTSFRPENLPAGGTLKQHRIRDDLCLRYIPSDDSRSWYGLRPVPEADRVEAMLAELKAKG